PRPAGPRAAAPPASGPAQRPAQRPAQGPWSDVMGRVGSRAGQTLLVAAVAVGAIWLLLQVSVVVIAMLVALILAAAVAPMVRWLTGKGWSNLLATATAFVGILLVLGGVITGVVFAIRSEWDSLATSAADGWSQFSDWLDTGPLPVDSSMLDDLAGQLSDAVMSGGVASGLASGTLSGISAAGQFLTGLVLMVVVLFFLLKDGPSITSFALRWFRGETRAKLAESVDRSAEVLGGYVRGTATVAAVDALLIGIGLLVVGVPLALPLAVLIFIGGFIPIVGATATGILAALVALVANGLVPALIVVAIVVVVQQIEGNFLQPVVMGRTLSLHALIVLLALTIGTLVGGIFGAVLAVPYTAVAWTLVQIWTDRYQAGDDPVLGADPLSAGSRASAKATERQRQRYARMRRTDRHGEELGATEQDEHGEVAADGRSDAGLTAGGHPDEGRDR
ncbi:MAG: AI-2E family transporter, partial [Actinomycetaceae bacterium]